MYAFSPIGVVHSCFKEKFGIPRQPGLAPEARAILELLPPYNRSESVRGLEDFSHIWVSFVFHACLGESWKPTVRPPRLGGNRRMGVFATRSTHRPNPIGLSAVELEKIVVEQGKVLLHLKGVDLLDGTPVLDIKPYLPYSDRIVEATGGFAATAPAVSFEVQFSQNALDCCATVPQLETLIRQILSLDPRPAYYGRSDGKQVFGMKLLNYDVQWEADGNVVLVNAVIPLGEMSIP